MANVLTGADRNAPLGRWVWLVPLAYAAHVIEEAFGGQGFVAWVVERGGPQMTVGLFFVLNIVGLALLAAATFLARRFRALQWLLATAGAILFMNGLIHFAAAIASRRYVPGMVTGLVLYLPLGSLVLMSIERRVRARVFWIAAAGGFAIHAAVLWYVAFGA